MAYLDPTKNFAIVEVSTGYNNTDTSIALTASEGAKLPQPSTDGEFNLVWWNSTDYPNPKDDPNVEIVRVTARSTDTLTVTRAQESTSGTTKNTGGKTYLMALVPTTKMMDDIESHLQGVKGSNIASATTTDLSAATGYFVDVTGTTTITGLGTADAGTRRAVRFNGALTLTHNGTSLILPTGANITTASGDIAEFASLGSGNWVCLHYMRADGTPLASSGGGSAMFGSYIDAFGISTSVYYHPIFTGHTGLVTSTEARVKYRFPRSGTLKNLSARFGGHPGGTVTIGIRKNGADTSLKIDGTSATGFADTSNTVAVTSSDDINFWVTGTSGSTGAMFVVFSCEFEPS